MKLTDDFVLVKTFVSGQSIKAVSDSAKSFSITSNRTSKLPWFSAVGAIADAVYQTGRVIPEEVQSAALSKMADEKRQPTTFLGHPTDPWPSPESYLGRLSDMACSVKEATFDPESKQTILNRVEILPTPEGEKAQALINSNIQFGISQRGIGKEEKKKCEDVNKELFFVSDLVVFGWDLVLLEDANAGPLTKIQMMNDNKIEKGIAEKKLFVFGNFSHEETRRMGKKIEESKGEDKQQKIEDVGTAKAGVAGDLEKDALDSGRDETKALEKSAEALAASNKSLAETLKDSIALCRDLFGEDEIQKLTGEQPGTLDRMVDEIAKNQNMNEKEKNDFLKSLSDRLVDLAQQKEEPRQEDKAPVGDGDYANKIKNVFDTMIGSLEKEKNKFKIKNKIEEELRKKEFQGSLKDLLADNIYSQVKDSDFSDEEIMKVLEKNIQLVNHGRSQERLAKMGFEEDDRIVKDVIQSNEPYLKGVNVLMDSFSRSGDFQCSLKDSEFKQKYPGSAEIVDQYDRLFQGKLAKEAKIIEEYTQEGQSIRDATTRADFDIPYTLSRIVLKEAYADDIINNITDLGRMDTDRDSIPIERWRRESPGPLASTFRPTVFQRNALKAPELTPMARGKLITVMHDIDSVARKLQATLSNEYISRAMRKGMSGVARATLNMAREVRRCLQVEIFFEYIRAAAAHGSTSFSYETSATGNDSVFHTSGTGDGDRVSIVPNDKRTPLNVQLGTTAANRVGVPEHGNSQVGGGPNGDIWFEADYAKAAIIFVDANGNPKNPPSGTNNILVTGYQATGEKRFNLNPPAGVSAGAHMARLGHEIALHAAKASSGAISNDGYYDVDSILSSNTTAALCKQADYYAADSRRSGFSADSWIPEGNFGQTAGLAHWGSKIFPDDFVVIADRRAVIFRVFTPAALYGPIEARDESGSLVAGKEWYIQQEDCIDTPIIEKCALVTLYHS